MLRIPLHVKEFASQRPELFEQFMDYWRHYRFQETKDAKYEYQKTRKDGSVITFEEKEAEMHETLMAEVNLRAGFIAGQTDGMSAEALSTMPTLRWAAFAIVGMLIDVAIPDVIIDSIGLYTEVRNAGFGDSFAFDIMPRDLWTVSKHGRAQRHAEVQKQHSGQVTIIPENRELTVQVSLYKVLAGKESLARFVSKAILSLEAELTKDVYTVFNTAMAALATSPAATALQVTGWTLDSFLGLAEKVSAWNGGAKPILVGTPRALASVLPNDVNYRYDIDSEFVKIGYMRTISGYDIMSLPQVANYTTPFEVVLTNERLYVISPGVDKLVKLGLEGSTTSHVDAVNSNANLTINATFNKSWGAAIATSAIAGTIDIS